MDIKGVNVNIRKNKGSHRWSCRVDGMLAEGTLNIPSDKYLQNGIDLISKTIDKKTKTHSINVFKDGGFVRVFGEIKRLRIYNNAKKDKICYLNDEVIVTLKEEFNEDRVKQLFKKLAKKELENYIDMRLPELEKLTGLYSKSHRVKYMISLWGRCQPRTGDLAFSVRLFNERKEYIDSVIIHELVHLKVSNHGSEFYKILYKYCPNYDNLKPI